MEFFIDNVLMVLHSIVISYIVNYCKGGSKRNIIYLSIFIYIAVVFTYIFTQNYYIAQFIVIIILSIFSINNYNDNFWDLILIYMIIYAISSLISISTYSIYILQKSYKITFYIVDKNTFRVLTQSVIQYIVLKLRYKIKALFEVTKYNRKFLICIFFINIIFQSVYKELYTNSYINFKYSGVGIFLVILFFTIIVFSFKYLIQITLQSMDINTLRLSIENKNNELRKIKHDYGAQISYLHGLYLLKRYDEMADQLESLKRINEETSCTAEVNTSKGSIMTEVVRQALDYGIHIMIYEYAEYDKFISKKDSFIQAIIDIINIQIKYMNKSDVIILKTYNSLGRLLIDIKFQSLECDKVILYEFLNNIDLVKLKIKKEKKCIKEIKRKILLDDKNDFKLKFTSFIHIRSFDLKLIIKK